MGQPPQWSSDDAAVLEYLAYLRQMMTASPQNGQGSSHLGSSAIGEAQALAHEDGPRRWEVEARLLAGQTDEEIAGHCNLPSQAVAQYEAIFFHVREIRRAIDYLLVHVIGDGPHRGFRDHEVRSFWAWTALAGGPVAVDLLIRTFHEVRKPDQPATLSVYLQPKAGIRLDLQAFVATMVLPPWAGAEQALRVLGLRLLEAQATVDPRRREFLRERSQKDTVRCAQAFLAGKPLPRLRHYSRKPKEHGPGQKQRSKGSNVREENAKPVPEHRL